ncbi:ATP-dependent Clp protease adaptor ClpS [bacterium]|nr:ATP-dependent Clp protease adaptor ClpS [bacterium]
MIEFNQTEIEEDVATEVDVDSGFAIILYNDDYNTFDHVIDCLIKYCKHSAEQAEQCSLIVHYKGKATVKHGSSTELSPVCTSLCREGLSAVIEEV